MQNQAVLHWENINNQWPCTKQVLILAPLKRKSKIEISPVPPWKDTLVRKFPRSPSKGYSGEKIQRNSPVLPQKGTLVKRNKLPKWSYTPPFFSIHHPPRNPRELWSEKCNRYFWSELMKLNFKLQVSSKSTITNKNPPRNLSKYLETIIKTDR